MNNPPAFPIPWGKSSDDQHDGMTLRDYFAAAAMQAIVGIQEAHDVSVTGDFKTTTAVYAYEMADAMLKARG